MRASHSLALAAAFTVACGSSGPSNQAPPDLAVPCTSPSTLCGAQCTSLDSDAKNCGACGKACDASYVCVAGKCALGCPTGQSACDTRCVDVMSDPAHCGACGTVCSPGMACSAGQCSVSCLPGMTNCSASCVNLFTDGAHCGGCANACPPGNTCVNGKCGLSCQAGLTNCNGTCVGVMTDNANCGGCGTACGAGQVCSGGSCGATCHEPLILCMGACADPRFDVANCGGCAVACAPANAVPACQMSVCTILSCKPGFADCNQKPEDGCEIPLGTLTDCGACGNKCSAANGTAACTSGVCTTSTCNQGFLDCNGSAIDGCEINGATDLSHCGDCKTVCPAMANGVPACTAGKCVVGQCADGFADCDGNPANGCEVNLMSDSNNCKACGAKCTAPQNASAACIKGVCGVGTCTGAFKDCNGKASDGCEVNIANDMGNCGACGVKCDAVANGQAACISAACGVGQCDRGFGDCDQKAANGCEVNLASDAGSCGACGNSCSNGQLCQMTTCGLNIAVEGHADVFVPCKQGEYSCEAHYVCNGVTGSDCVYQPYDCLYGDQGSWYPLDGSSGDSNFNFAITYDVEPESDYGNICACNQSQMDRYGLASNHTDCGYGHWVRQ